MVTVHIINVVVFAVSFCMHSLARHCAIFQIYDMVLFFTEMVL